MNFNESGKEYVDVLFEEVSDNFRLSEVMLGMCIFYTLLFVFGIIGNCWVITVVAYIFKKIWHVIQTPNVFLYIFALSTVDSLVLCTLPMLISNVYWFHWIFGEYLCKIYWIVESSNKLLSTFLLVALSCDRYFAICRSKVSYNIHSIRSTLTIIVCLVALVAILLTPVYRFANQFDTYQSFITDTETLNVSIPTCYLSMTDDLVFLFTIYMFIVCFCIPSLLIVYFYLCILYKLYEHKLAIANSTHIHSHIPLSKVTRTAFLLIIFYFICWTPYWCITMYMAIVTSAKPDLGEVHIMYVMHALVYVHSAFDWILYAYMNHNLRECKEMALNHTSQSRKCSRIVILAEENNHHSPKYEHIPFLVFTHKISMV